MVLVLSGTAVVVEQDVTAWLVLLMVLDLMGFGESLSSVGHAVACGFEFLVNV